MNNSIIELNREVEPFIVQATATRTKFFAKKFGDKYEPLQFVHFSDIHAVMDLWNRISEFINYYKDYISFGLHTGDYCGDNQHLYADFYNCGFECDRPIYNCVGNHDTFADHSHKIAPKELTHRLLFAPMPDITRDVTFMDCDYSMAYYKDFPSSNVRLIVLDLYYDIDLQKEWLRQILDDAGKRGISVITAMHEPTAQIVESYGVTFNTINDYIGLYGEHKTMPYEEIIVDFVKNGGEHICNLSGHHHHDLFGITKSGILNTSVPCATTWNGWSDGKRVKGTKTYDCFNVVSVDVNLGMLKIIRIGDPCDHYLREKKLLCFDYKNRKVITN